MQISTKRSESNLTFKKDIQSTGTYHVNHVCEDHSVLITVQETSDDSVSVPLIKFHSCNEAETIAKAILTSVDSIRKHGSNPCHQR